MKSKYLLSFATLLSLALASCSEKETTSIQTPESSELTALLLTEKPETPISVQTLRKTAKPGDQVTFTGAAIGGDQIFMAERAIMIMGDPEILTSCDRRPADNCPTPWDVCCDDPETIKSSIVTVQILDKTGSPLKTGLKGLSGLKELSTLTITGTVSPDSNEANMIVNATALHIEQ